MKVLQTFQIATLIVHCPFEIDSWPTRYMPTSVEHTTSPAQPGYRCYS